MKDLVCFVEEEIGRHRKRFDPKSLKDFIDVYLNEVSCRAVLNKKDDVCSEFEHIYRCPWNPKLLVL